MTDERKPSNGQYKQVLYIDKASGKRSYSTSTVGETDFLMTDVWRELRKVILKRDGFICQKCGAAYPLRVHHIVYPEVWGEEKADDLITLCDKCHESIHRQGGNHDY